VTERALDPADVVPFEISDSDVVGLSRRGIEEAREVLPDLVGAMEGQQSPPEFLFEMPDYSGQTGADEVEPGVYQVTGFDGGLADWHLIVFAHMVRPFSWSGDERFEQQLEILEKPDSLNLREVSTQDLWDALFSNARVGRFGDGPLDNPGGGVTAVSNEILRRLFSAIEAGSRLDLTVD
jgi:hypothetical protein